MVQAAQTDADLPLPGVRTADLVPRPGERRRAAEVDHRRLVEQPHAPRVGSAPAARGVEPQRRAPERLGERAVADQPVGVEDQHAPAVGPLRAADRPHGAGRVRGLAAGAAAERRPRQRRARGRRRRVVAREPPVADPERRRPRHDGVPVAQFQGAVVRVDDGQFGGGARAVARRCGADGQPLGRLADVVRQGRDVRSVFVGLGLSGRDGRFGPREDRIVRRVRGAGAERQRHRHLARRRRARQPGTEMHLGFAGAFDETASPDDARVGDHRRRRRVQAHGVGGPFVVDPVVVGAGAGPDMLVADAHERVERQSRRGIALSAQFQLQPPPARQGRRRPQPEGVRLRRAGREAEHVHGVGDAGEVEGARGQGAERGAPVVAGGAVPGDPGDGELRLPGGPHGLHVAGGAGEVDGLGINFHIETDPGPRMVRTAVRAPAAAAGAPDGIVVELSPIPDRQAQVRLGREVRRGREAHDVASRLGGHGEPVHRVGDAGEGEAVGGQRAADPVADRCFRVGDRVAVPVDVRAPDVAPGRVEDAQRHRRPRFRPLV